jgi:zinc protease
MMLFGNIGAGSASGRSGRPRLACAALATWAALALAWPASTPARTATASVPAVAATELIPYEKFTLENGLTVVVHTDRKAPIVAVNLWYHVGSKNEPAGRTGFAHLFEHLMFQGTENFDDEYCKPLELFPERDDHGA